MGLRCLALLISYLNSDGPVLNVSSVQHQSTALVITVVLGGDVLDQQAVDIFDIPVTVQYPYVLLIPVDQRRRIRLDFASDLVARTGYRVLFDGSVYPCDVI